MYLVCLWEAKQSKHYPYWSKSLAELNRTYNISDDIILKGLKELERENMLELYRLIIDIPDSDDKQINIYCRVNPLISNEEYQSTVDALITIHGKKLFEQAKTLSSQLNDPKDLEHIKTFINLILSYGYKQVHKTNTVTAQKKEGFGLYDISHTVKLLLSESSKPR